MRTAPSRASARSARGLAIGLVAIVGLAFGPAGVAGARQVHPKIERISVSSRTVPAGGLLLIGTQARYRVPEEFAVSYYFDLAKVDMPEEWCDTGTGPDNGDNPSCEYDNTFMNDTSTVGLFHVAPTATGRFTVTVCTETVSFGGGPNSPDDRCEVRSFRIT
jgi:hypothetical protein